MPPMNSSPSASFDIRAVEQAIAGTEFAGSVMHFAAVTSTNDLALQAAQAGERHGVWIADQQTAGRGRGSHAWHSAPGTPLEPAGLYMSALITPPIGMQSALGLSLRTAIAVQSALVSVLGLRRREEIDIRWPNDLLLNGRKVGGVLIETAAQPASACGPSMLRYAVIGIGINCNQSSFPLEIDAIATSLRRELAPPSQSSASQPVLREPLVAAILRALDEEVSRMMRGWSGAGSLDDRDLSERNSWISECSSWITGKPVHVDEDGGYTGVTVGLDPHGFLRVAGDDGILRTVRSGGVRAN
jgi:BirA family biotin operon repressor/biotin-[acetyl-CoA-carboxylase] ligase